MEFIAKDRISSVAKSAFAWFPGSGSESAQSATKPDYEMALPKDSGRKVALCRTLASIMSFADGPIVWVTATGVWPSSEHMELFDRYRQAHGESRGVASVPAVRLFAGEEDAFVSFLYLSLSFVWDAVVLDTSMVIRVSHDEYLSIWTNTRSKYDLERMLRSYEEDGAKSN